MKTFKNLILVDNSDYDLLKKYSWCISVNGYAVARVEGRVVYMHRLILGTRKGKFTDHINGNKLDNRRSNLRICTPAQNAKNQSLRSNNTSGYKGVSWNKKRLKWEAYIKNDYKRKFLGYFTSAQEASEAYQSAATFYHKDFARSV